MPSVVMLDSSDVGQHAIAIPTMMCLQHFGTALCLEAPAVSGSQGWAPSRGMWLVKEVRFHVCKCLPASALQVAAIIHMRHVLSSVPAISGSQGCLGTRGGWEWGRGGKQFCDSSSSCDGAQSCGQACGCHIITWDDVRVAFQRDWHCA
jgi:hypothetical protein